MFGRSSQNVEARVAVLESSYDSMQRSLSELMVREDRAFAELKDQVASLLRYMNKSARETERLINEVKTDIVERNSREFSTKSEMRDAVTGLRASLTDHMTNDLKEAKKQIEEEIKASSQRPVTMAYIAIASFSTAIIFCGWFYINILKDSHETHNHNTGDFVTCNSVRGGWNGGNSI